MTSKLESFIKRQKNTIKNKRIRENLQFEAQQAYTPENLHILVFTSTKMDHFGNGSTDGRTHPHMFRAQKPYPLADSNRRRVKKHTTHCRQGLFSKLHQSDTAEQNNA